VSKPGYRRHQLRKTLMALWPQWPLAVALIYSGLLNIFGALQYNPGQLVRLPSLPNVGESLSLLGGGAQLVLGAGLVLTGVGLLWRLQPAWGFAVLLLTLTIGVNLVRGLKGPGTVLPGVMLVVLLVLRNSFTRRFLLANYLISMVGILAILTYGSFGSYLLGSAFRPRINDLATAFYFTVVTLSTVGYGDIVPNTEESRLFVVSMLVIGLGIFATVLATTIGPAVSRELNRIFSPKGEEMRPKDHVIVLGTGAIARSTVRELADRDIPFVQVAAPGSEPAEKGGAVIVGDPSSDETLREAGIDAARMVVAATDDDGDNAFIALAAKDLNPKVRVLAVASSTRSMRRLRLARADLVFAPVMVGSRLIADLVEGTAIPEEFQDLLKVREQQGQEK
jgi:voltage-gated potassium channel